MSVTLFIWSANSDVVLWRDETGVHTAVGLGVQAVPLDQWLNVLRPPAGDVPIPFDRPPKSTEIFKGRR